MSRYKLLCGQHIDGHHSHAGDHVYVEGDLIDTDKDLCRFNAVGMEPKFERLHEDGRMTRDEWEKQEREKIGRLGAQQQELKAKAAAEQLPAPAPVSPSVPAQQQPPSHGQRQQGKVR